MRDIFHFPEKGVKQTSLSVDSTTNEEEVRCAHNFGGESITLQLRAWYCELISIFIHALPRRNLLPIRQ